MFRCRVCIEININCHKPEELIRITDNAEREEEYPLVSFIECFRTCTGLEAATPNDVDDNPLGFCDECAHDLASAYAFLKKAEKSDKLLQRMFTLEKAESAGIEEFTYTDDAGDVMELITESGSVDVDYQCETCLEIFTSEDMLDLHVANQHCSAEEIGAEFVAAQELEILQIAGTKPLLQPTAEAEEKPTESDITFPTLRSRTKINTQKVAKKEPELQSSSNANDSKEDQRKAEDHSEKLVDFTIGDDDQVEFLAAHELEILQTPAAELLLQPITEAEGKPSEPDTAHRILRPRTKRKGQEVSKEQAEPQSSSGAYDAKDDEKQTENDVENQIDFSTDDDDEYEPQAKVKKTTRKAKSTSSSNTSWSQRLQEKRQERMYPCWDCDKTFKLRNEYILHRKDVHQVKANCLICKIKLGVSMTLRQHNQENHSAIVQCPKCDFKDKEYKLAQHQRRMHVREREYACDLCSQSFNKALLLKEHVKEHQQNGEVYKTPPCEECGKTFSSKQYLYKHRLVHRKDRPTYPCEYCDKVFVSRNSLEPHLRLHLGDTEKCPECGKEFTRSHELKIHMRFHSRDFPYICEICGKSFAIKGHLRTHMFRHQGYRMRCDYCGRLFQSIKALKEHIFIHTEMPFPCKHCPKEYPSKQKYAVHLQNAHKITLTREEYRALKGRGESEAKPLKRQQYTILSPEEVKDLEEMERNSPQEAEASEDEDEQIQYFVQFEDNSEEAEEIAEVVEFIEESYATMIESDEKDPEPHNI